MPHDVPRVAICQSNIIPGGRLRVVLGIVRALNEMGIVPDILTASLGIQSEEIPGRYGQTARFQFRHVSRLPTGSQDAAILAFNWSLHHYARDYDILINTSNSLLLLPPSKRVLSYMFFPRKYRVLANDPDIHRPGHRLSWWKREELIRQGLRPLYRHLAPQPHHAIICMTHFTCQKLHEVYPQLPQLPIVYPPVDIQRFWCENEQRERSIVTAGRFSPSKRQLEQIELAAQLPDITFHLVGFTSPDNPYFQLCQERIKQLGLQNVHLHANAPFDVLLQLLQHSRYFLHTLINEPFGLTAVQAMAAGCIPIVHDSGGQRETVPEPLLRYQALADVPLRIAELDALAISEINDLRQRLHAHVRQFSADHFQSRIRAQLGELL